MSQKEYKHTRRSFIQKVSAATALGLASGLVSAQGAGNRVSAGMTIQQVIDLILKEIPGAPFDKTVDTVKSSDAQQQVKGIVTTMFATIDVIKKAVSLGANFIIAHEPTFYSHTDETESLSNDPVYQFKRDLLEKNKIVVWRFHDYWHTHRPDGVLMGVLTKFGWEKYYNANDPSIVDLPGVTVQNIIGLAKKGMGIRQVRYVGDLKQNCKKIALIPGAAGGTRQMQVIRDKKPDVLIVGEVHEWETAEYVRDARAMGTQVSLIVLGHAESEEPGMEWLVPWLTPKVKDVKVTHVPSHNPFMEA